jgi:mono/diheme cytochrome c family protein
MWRRLAIVIAMGITLTLATWTLTQQGAMGQGMMGQGMMRVPAQPGDQGAGPGPSIGPGIMGPGHRSGPGRSARQEAVYGRPLISEMLSIRDRLGLTPSQVQRLQALRSGFEKEAIERRAKIQADEVDLSDLLGASPLDLAKIEDLTRKIGVLEGELRFARIKTLEAGRAVLTQKQWEDFQSMAPGTDPMGAHGGRWRQGEMGPGMMGGYGGPGGPGAMMGPGPGLASGKRTFASNGERIYYTGTSAKTGPIPRTGGPMWVNHAGVGCVACHGVQGRGGVPVMMGTALPEDIRYPILTATEPPKEGDKKEAMDHPPFTDATIKQAVTQGVDPANKPLDWTMPRWQLTDEDWTDLLAYLKTLK